MPHALSLLVSMNRFAILFNDHTNPVHMNYLFLIIAVLLISHSGFSQRILAGNSISYLAGAGDFGDAYDTGFGICFNTELKIIGQLGLTGEFGWNHWSGNSDYPGSKMSDINVFDLLVGGKIGLWLIYLEARTGYYFGDVEEFVVIPAVGLRLGKLDLNVGYQLAENFNFVNFRLGYFWIGGKKK